MKFTRKSLLENRTFVELSTNTIITLELIPEKSIVSST